MRRFLAAALFCATALPAAAQSPSIYDQYVAGRATVHGGFVDYQDYTTDYRKMLFEGIEGVWFPIGVLGPERDDPELFERACASQPVTISIRDPYTLDFVVKKGTTNELTTTYSSKGGNVFGSYSDPATLLRRLGIDVPGRESAVFGVLNSVNGIATILRPSPDVIVVQTNYGIPQIFARCAA